MQYDSEFVIFVIIMSDKFNIAIFRVNSLKSNNILYHVDMTTKRHYKSTLTESKDNVL